jgi:hypothetical protein
VSERESVIGWIAKGAMAHAKSAGRAIAAVSRQIDADDVRVRITVEPEPVAPPAPTRAEPLGPWTEADGEAIRREVAENARPDDRCGLRMSFTSMRCGGCGNAAGSLAPCPGCGAPRCGACCDNHRPPPSTGTDATCPDCLGTKCLIVGKGSRRRAVGCLRCASTGRVPGKDGT